MRRWLSMAVLVALVTAFAGCGSDDPVPGRRAGSASSTPVAPEEVVPGEETADPVGDGVEPPTAPRAGRRSTSSGGGSRAGAAAPAGSSAVPVADVGPRPASENRTGVTKDRILVGVHAPKSSAAAAVVRDAFEGFNVYVDRLNQRGGIAGRRIEVVEADDQFTVAGGTAAAKQLDQAGVFLVFNIAGADPAIGAFGYLEEKRIPYFTVALPFEKLREAKTTFFMGPPLEVQSAAAPSYMANVQGLKGEKVGLIYERPTIYQEMKRPFMAEAAKVGLNIVIEEEVEEVAPSYSSNVRRVQGSGATAVALIGALAVPGILRDARAIGYTPEWGGVGPWTLNFFNDASGGLMEDIKAVRAFQGVDGAGYREYAKAMQDEGRGREASEVGYIGWTQGVFLEHALARAGADPTREWLVQALEQTGQNPIVMGDTPHIAYAPGRHWGTEEVLPTQVRDRVWVRIGDYARRF